MAAVCALGATAVLALGAAGSPAASPSYSQTIERLHLPSFGHSHLYEVTLSGKLAAGEHISAADFSVHIGNLAALPSHIRAAYAQGQPTTSHGTWKDVFLVVINFPKVLSSADAYAARPDAAELIFRALVSEAAPSIDGTIRVIACVKGVKFNEDWDIKKFSKMLTQGSSTPKDVEKRSVKRPACQG